MLNTSISYDEGLMTTEGYYTIGTNDGKEFRKVRFVGNKLMYGKQIMVFKTEDNEELTVNPSYHTFTLTHKQGERNNGTS